jgi:hypothetical protein
MPIRWPGVAIPLLLVTIGVVQSDGQSTGRIRYVPSPDDIAAYFQGQLSANIDDALAYYGARYLHTMEEKPLPASDPQASELYRVLVETRPHNAPVLVRLSIGTDGTAEVVTKVGGDPYRGDLAINTTADVSHAKVDEFLGLLASSAFWSMPVQQPREKNGYVVLGEPSWMFEGSKVATYHVVCRNTSGLASPKRAELFLLTNIGGVDLTGKL